MKLIRTIKLKQIAGELDHLNDFERYFIKRFDKLIEDHMDWGVIYYFSNKDEYFFEYNYNSKTFWISGSNVWLKFKMKFKVTPTDFIKNVRKILVEDLNFDSDIKVRVENVTKIDRVA